MIIDPTRTASDVAAREALLDEAFGQTPLRARRRERLRDGRLPAEGLAFVAVDGERVVGTARLWNVAGGTGRPALLLGPRRGRRRLPQRAASAPR